MRIKFVNILLLLMLETVFYLYSDTYFAFFLLLFTGLLLFVSFVYLFLVKGKMRITVDTAKAAYKREAMPIKLQIDNRSFLPVVKAVCHIHMYNRLTGEAENERIAFSILPKYQRQVKLHFTSRYSGYIQMEVEAITFYDMFGLFSYTENIHASTSFYILPNAYHMNVKVSDEASKINENLDRWVNKVGLGQEYFNLKTYVPGDNVKQIHWKLSSKLNDIILKENSATVSESYLVLFETTYQNDMKRPKPKVIDAMLEVHLSISKALIERGKMVSVGWQSRRGEPLHVVQASSFAELQQLYPRLLEIEWLKSDETVLEAFAKQGREDFSCIIYITTDERAERDGLLSTDMNLYVVTALDEAKIENIVEGDMAFVPKRINGNIYELSG